jgi:hypothetical protein
VAGAVSQRAARLRSQASKTLSRLRKRGEKVVGQGWDAALEALPGNARRAMREAAGALRRLTTDLDRRRARALKAVEKRSEELVERVEKGALQAVQPVIHRLDVASKKDVERLSRRVAMLERRVHRPERKTKHAAAA